MFFLFPQVLSAGSLWTVHWRHCDLPDSLHLQSELYKEPILDCQAGGGVVRHQPCGTTAHSAFLRDVGEPPTVCQSACARPHEVLHRWKGHTNIYRALQSILILFMLNYCFFFPRCGAHWSHKRVLWQVHHSLSHQHHFQKPLAKH